MQTEDQGGWLCHYAAARGLGVGKMHSVLGVVQTQRKSASQIWRGTGQDGFGNGDQQLD